jgi:hypothetical protein
MSRPASPPRPRRPDRYGPAGLALAALATAGCAEVFGAEPPPSLANTGGSTVYDGAGRAVAYLPPGSVVELRAPGVIVVRAPGSMEPLVTVTSAVDRPQAVQAPRASRRSLRSLYQQEAEEATPVPPAPYKPSPYDELPPPRLYRDD